MRSKVSFAAAIVGTFITSAIGLALIGTVEVLLFVMDRKNGR